MKDQFNFGSSPFAADDGSASVNNPQYIRRIQQALNRKLGLQLPLDGVMGFRTRRAIRNFQLQKGLPADGIDRSDTLRALLSNTASRMEPTSEFNFEWEALGDEFDDAYSIDATESEWLESEWEKMDGSKINTSAAKVVSKDILKRAGLKTTTRANKRTPMLIQTVLEQSLVLRPFISTKLGKISIPKNLVQYPHGDTGFDYKYQKLKKVVVPLGSKELINVGGFYDRATDSIYLRSWANVGLVLQLAIHKFSSPAFFHFFGESLVEGLGLYFTNLVLKEQGLEQRKPENFKDQLDCATDLVGVVSQSMVGQAYFQNHSDLVNHLTTKLSIGPVSTTELANDALFKKPLLLRTASFANHQMKNMVGVGMTGPESVRLWMRSAVAGPHEVQIKKGSILITNTKIEIPEAGDKTFAVNCPNLNPLTKYQYEIVRTSDRTSLGKGSFETSPAREADTPEKVVIALMSCHQPFSDRGTIRRESVRMLRLLPRILRENNVKFVLPCGDQIYADDPGDMSLFNKENPYLIRQVIPRKKSIKEKSIKECTADEVRRLYDMRYRTFWSLNPIREMYANYPCYPTLDDHEIKDSWGTQPEHSGKDYLSIKQGALDAYYDYQASSVLPQKPSGSFHYSFSYGNIGIFVMDLRSERRSSFDNLMYSADQLKDLKTFLEKSVEKNNKKKVLFIVCSVPVVFVPSGLATVGGWFKPTTFHDHWSHGKNIEARNTFLSVLHEHQQNNPDQRVAILSGDVHIGNAVGIQWQELYKPRLYQFTSSPISVNEPTRTKGKIVAAPLFATGSRIDFGDERFHGRVSPLSAAKVSGFDPITRALARSGNYVGMNVGIIEVQRTGNVSKLKFKLIGAHPTEERPVTYFESGWLG